MLGKHLVLAYNSAKWPWSEGKPAPLFYVLVNQDHLFKSYGTLWNSMTIHIYLTYNFYGYN